MASKIVSNEVNLNEQQRFTWIIPNFTNKREMGEIRSNMKLGSAIGLPSDFEWTCSLLSSSNSDNFDTLKIELSKRPTSVKELNATFRVQIKDDNHNDSFYYDSNIGSVVNMVEHHWTCNPSIPLDRASTRSKLPNQNNSMEIEILTTLCTPKNNTVEDILNQFKGKFAQKLQSDFAAMLQQPMISKSDYRTEIICNFGNSRLPRRIFRINRGMLAARSNVFLQMFESKLNKQCTETVHVTDVLSGVMEIILHFLYTGTLLENWTTVPIEQLFAAAGKFDVSDLLEFLDKVVGQLCTTENAGKLMKLAIKFNLRQAKKELFNFIKISSESYEQFEELIGVPQPNNAFEQGYSDAESGEDVIPNYDCESDDEGPLDQY